MLGPVFRSRKLSWIEKVPSAIELTMPTMVTLLTEFIALSCLNLGAISLSHHPFLHPLPLALLFTNFLMALAIALYAMSPVLVFGLPWSYLGSLIHLPAYAFWKLTIKLRGRPMQWVRTALEQQTNRARKDLVIQTRRESVEEAAGFKVQCLSIRTKPHLRQVTRGNACRTGRMGPTHCQEPQTRSHFWIGCPPPSGQ